MRRFTVVAFALLGLSACATQQHASRPPHDIIIFVADGLRYGAVNDTDAPALAAARREGVDFANSHSIYPTLTTVNAAAIATGHAPGDSGDYGNWLYLGEPPLPHASSGRVALLEDDSILHDMDDRFGGNYLHETTLFAAASQRGYNVVSMGKTGPSGIQIRGNINGAPLLIDEGLGQSGSPALPPDMAAAFTAAHLALTSPARALPNLAAQDWLSHAATDVVLPYLQHAGKPFILLYWSPDPDITQHSQHDSANALTPGINAATSRAAVANASGNLGRLRDALAASGLAVITDLVMIADHGFSTTSKQSATSYAARQSTPGVPAGELPPGFLGADLSHELGLTLFHPAGAATSALLGASADTPQVIVAANGGSDLIYLLGDNKVAEAQRIVAFLTTQDYTGAIFTADALGRIPGALQLHDINLTGAALTPQPSIVVSFRTSDTGCANPEMCGVEIADAGLPQGSGYHGAFGRADTRNFMAAVGPDFRAGFVDPTPVSNADIAPTLAHILGFDLPAIGRLHGRVIGEALPGGEAAGPVSTDAPASDPAANGFRTVLNRQTVGATRYFDSAGDTSRTP